MAPIKKITTMWPIILIAYSTACEHATKPIDGQSPVIPDVINIIWTLESVAIGDQDIDLSTFEPFTLVYNDTSFFGSDGCNSFGGFYKSKNDSIFTDGVWITLMACTWVKTYSPCFLGAPYRVEITDNKLMIFKDIEIYTFYSDYMNSIQDSPLLSKEWTLTSSNDPEFDIMNAPQFTSTLFFNENRKFDFYIQWYSYKYNALFHNTSYGVFGIGDNSSIWLYPVGGGGAGDCANRILYSSSYFFNDSLLVLVNESDSLRYKFASKAG